MLKRSENNPPKLGHKFSAMWRLFGFMCATGIGLSILNCHGNNVDSMQEAKKTLEIQGHRGCRGLMPENTIPAFLHALELGVKTLELDLAVSADSILVVSHEPWLNPEIASDSAGERIEAGTAMSYNLHEMTLAEIERYDVGLQTHPRFPEQQKMSVSKPTLQAVIDTVRTYAQQHNLGEINFNIEIKSLPEGDDIYHPTPANFCSMVNDFILKNKLENSVYIQSFDARVLEAMHVLNPNIKLSWLTENAPSIDWALAQLSFTPNAYSPDYASLTKSKIDTLHQQNISVFAWTVNDVAVADTLKNWGIDAIITDYPDRIK